jgi:hypothetical protein
MNPESRYVLAPELLWLGLGVLALLGTILLWRRQPTARDLAAEDAKKALRDEILQLAEDAADDLVELNRELAGWGLAELQVIRERLLAQEPPRLLDAALEAFDNAERARLGLTDPVVFSARNSEVVSLRGNLEGNDE